MSIAVNKYKNSRTGGKYYHQFSDSKIKTFSKFLSELDVTLVLDKTDPKTTYNKFYQDYKKKNI